MRTFLLAALALSTSHTSTACGWEPPRLVAHQVTSHQVKLADQTWERRAFVVYGDAPKIDEAQWRPLAPETYDTTRLAELSTQRTMVTLLGPEGTRVVTSNHRVALDAGWQLDGHAHVAFEVDATDKEVFSIALDGNFAGAVWHELQGSYTRTQPIAGTNVAAVGTKDGVVIRVDKTDVMTIQANVLGAVDYQGQRYIVTRDAKSALAVIDIGSIPAAGKRA